MISFTESELKVEAFPFIYLWSNSVRGLRKPEIAPFVDGLQHGNAFILHIVSCATQNGGKRVWLDVRVYIGILLL